MYKKRQPHKLEKRGDEVPVKFDVGLSWEGIHRYPGPLLIQG
jgi:hypothetical protein